MSPEIHVDRFFCSRVCGDGWAVKSTSQTASPCQPARSLVKFENFKGAR